MLELIESYERKVAYIKVLLTKKGIDETTTTRLKIKLGCYRAIIKDVKNELKLIK